MSILLIPRKSEDDVDIIDSSRLSYFQVTYWDIEVIIVLWVLFLVTSLFVLLRLYSRVKILQFYAAEDHLYNVAFVSFVGSPPRIKQKAWFTSAPRQNRDQPVSRGNLNR